MNNPYAPPTPITSRDDWRLKGACRGHDPELWYPTDADRQRNQARGERAAQAARITEAKRICHTCPILLTCRAHALNTHEEHGIFGGLTASERRQVLRSPHMTKSNVGVPLTDRFWQRVPHRPVDGCWEWAGERNNMGYGRISEYRGGVRVRHLAHRFSLALVQDVPKDAVVRHRCDNPVCVNPDHLEVGTQRDNVRDAIARGRFNATGLKDGRRVRTHCRRGHALTPQNRLASGNCKSCNRIYQAAYRARCGLTTEERHQVIAHRMPA